MKRIPATLAVAVAAVLLSGQSAPPASQPDDTHWTDLIARLGNDDFATRDAAQKELDATTTWRDLDRLRSLAKSTADPEAKSRLSVRIATLEEKLATDPPPISLDCDNDSLDQMVDKLSKTLGIKISAWPPGQRTNARFTLHVKDKPFWEVFNALTDQHPLSFMSNPQEIQLMSNSGENPISNCVIHGPIMVVPQTVSRQRFLNFQAPAGKQLQPETIQFSCNVMLDPRLHIAQFKGAQFTEITDDQHNVLFQQPVREQSFMGRERPVSESVSVPLNIPANPGTRIASVKGQIAFSVATAVDTIVVDDPDKKKGDTFQVAGLSIKLTQFDLRDTSLNLGFQRNSVGLNLGLARTADDNKTIHVEVIDANDKTIASTEIRGGTSGWGSSGAKIATPVKMRLSAPTKTKDVTIPFELKDLPLP